MNTLSMPSGVGYIDATDMGTAARLQRALLPPTPFSHGEWSVAHHFAPAAAVGGDIIDLVPDGDRLFFLLADVAGKGVGASLVTAYLLAIFRSLVPLGLALEDLVARASALLCSSTLPWQYVTLVAGFLGPDGEVELANAGHPSPLVLTNGRHPDLVPTGAPAGMFCDSRYGTTRLTLARHDTLLLYSDGVSETVTDAGNDYGDTRLREIAGSAASLPVSELVTAVATDHAAVAGAEVRRDDVTVLAVRRQADSADRRRPADSRCVSRVNPRVH